MAKKRIPSTKEERISKRDELFEALSRESDRGLILVSASYLDIALENLLRSRFSTTKKKPQSCINPLFDTFGPLATFSAKIKMALALDLIEEWTYRDLEIIRKLRNEFAHGTHKVSFDSLEVTKLTETLKGADHAVTHLTSEQTEKKSVTKRNPKSRNASKALMEKTRVAMTVSFIAGLIHVQIEK